MIRKTVLFSMTVVTTLLFPPATDAASSSSSSKLNQAAKASASAAQEIAKTSTSAASTAASAKQSASLTTDSLATLSQVDRAVVVTDYHFGIQLQPQDAATIAAARTSEFHLRGYWRKSSGGEDYYDRSFTDIYPWLENKEINEAFLAGKMRLMLPILFYTNGRLEPLSHISCSDSRQFSWQPQHHMLYTLVLQRGPPPAKQLVLADFASEPLDKK